MTFYPKKRPYLSYKNNSGQMDRWTDRKIDRRTNVTSCRDAQSHLRILWIQKFWPKEKQLLCFFLFILYCVSWGFFSLKRIPSFNSSIQRKKKTRTRFPNWVHPRCKTLKSFVAFKSSFPYSGSFMSLRNRYRACSFHFACIDSNVCSVYIPRPRP